MLDRVTGLPLSRALQNGNFSVSNIQTDGGKTLLEFKNSSKRYLINPEGGTLVKYEEFDAKAPNRLLVSIENSEFIKIG